MPGIEPRLHTSLTRLNFVLLSGYSESNRDHTHPKRAYYHYTIPRNLGGRGVRTTTIPHSEIPIFHLPESCYMSFPNNLGFREILTFPEKTHHYTRNLLCSFSSSNLTFSSPLFINSESSLIEN